MGTRGRRHGWYEHGIAGGAVYAHRDHADSTATLLKVESRIAGSCQVHLTQVDSNGVASMDSVDGLEIEARSTVESKPGGYHVMLVDLRRNLKEGEKLSFVLTFRNAGPITIQAVVKAP